MNRALRAATMGVLLLSPVALSACSAGTQAQTITMVRDQSGAQAEAGQLLIRVAVLEHPRSGSYERGDDAELHLAIVNTGEEPDTLTGVSGKDFTDAELEAATGDGASDEIEVAPNSSVLVDGDEYTITLTGLREALTVGQQLDLVLTFENAGEVPVTVTVATPERELPRGDGFDFHEGAE